MGLINIFRKLLRKQDYEESSFQEEINEERRGFNVDSIKEYEKKQFFTEGNI